MSVAGPSSDEILKAIKASGYLMEQEVATLIETLGFQVQTNRAFQDPDESKSREIDVWAFKQFCHNETAKISLILELICECKNNSNPFVFFGRTKNSADRIQEPKEFIFPISKYKKMSSKTKKSKTFSEIPAFTYLDLGKKHYYYGQNMKAVQFCKIVRDKKSWKAEHGNIYDAIFYPIVKALLSRQEEAKMISGDWKYVWLFFPIVILNSEIYYLDSMADTPNIQQVNHIAFSRELRSPNINGRFLIDFVNKKGLRDYIELKIMSFAKELANMVETSPDNFLKDPY